MGYSHGEKWTNEKIFSALQKVVSELQLTTFPTKKQIFNFYGNSRLCSKISKCGGTKFWANKLNLPIKDCESKMGSIWENNCINELEQKNYYAEKMKEKYPYDILVNNCLKIDVKSAYIYTNKKNNQFYTFNLEKKFQTCDMFICYCLNDYGISIKTYIIPSVKLSGIKQLSIGKNKSIYDKYINRWDLIEKYVKFLHTTS